MSDVIKLALALTDLAAREPIEYGYDGMDLDACMYCESENTDPATCAPWVRGGLRISHYPDCSWLYIHNNLDTILGRFPTDPG